MIDSKVIQGRFGNKHHRNYSKIVNFLHSLLGHVKDDEVQLDPSGVVVILINENKETELLHVGVTNLDLQECASQLSNYVNKKGYQ